MSLVNNALVDHVSVPPIPAFKSKAREISPVGGRSFDMTQAVPSFLTYEIIREKLAEDLRAGNGCFYTEGRGLERLRRLIRDGHHLLGGWPLENMMITAGANHAMFTALLSTLPTGSTVVMPDPVYFNYDMALPMLGLRAAYCPMSADNGMALDANRMIQWIESSAPEARAIVLITPNNPTGARYESPEILRLLEWTSRRGIEVVLDETYRWFDNEHLRDARLAQYLGRGLSLVGSFSKAFSLTGYRVGYWIAGQDQILQGMKVQDTMVICPPHLGQLAATYGLENCLNEVTQAAARMKVLVDKALAVNSSLRRFRVVSAGAFFAFLKHPFGHLSADDAALQIYRETGILGLPGTVFGATRKDFTRLSVCNLSPDDLEAALTNLVAFDDRLAR